MFFNSACINAYAVEKKEILNVHRFFRTILRKFKLHFTSSNWPGVSRTHAAVSTILIMRSMADGRGVSHKRDLRYRQG